PAPPPGPVRIDVQDPAVRKHGSEQGDLQDVLWGLVSPADLGGARGVHGIHPPDELRIRASAREVGRCEVETPETYPAQRQDPPCQRARGPLAQWIAVAVEE